MEDNKEAELLRLKQKLLIIRSIVDRAVIALEEAEELISKFINNKKWEYKK